MSNVEESRKKKTVFVIYYSTYGHVATMAKHVCKGLEKSGGNLFLKSRNKSFPELELNAIF